MCALVTGVQTCARPISRHGLQVVVEDVGPGRHHHLESAILAQEVRRQHLDGGPRRRFAGRARSEEHTSELQSLMRISYAVFCLKKKKLHNTTTQPRKSVTHTEQHDPIQLQQTKLQPE